MRVIDSLFFALVFLVDSIVCSVISKLDPNHYRVVRMSAAHLHGVLAQYETQFETSHGTWRGKEYHLVQEVENHLDVVVKDGRIIGSTDHSRNLIAICRYFDNGMGRLFATMRLIGSHEADNPQILWGASLDGLGMFRQLPDDTIFEDGLQRNELPLRTIVHVNGESQIIRVSHEPVHRE